MLPPTHVPTLGSLESIFMKVFIYHANQLMRSVTINLLLGLGTVPWNLVR